MIKQNKFEFGYGDIAVGSDWCGKISFQSIKPPTLVGNSIPDGTEYLDDEVILTLTYEELIMMETLLKDVKNNTSLTFDFKEFIFDI